MGKEGRKGREGVGGSGWRGVAGVFRYREEAWKEDGEVK